MPSDKVFSLEGKGLKLDTAGDVEPHIKALRDNVDVEEVHLQGNTLGIGASEALAKVLGTKKNLQVSKTGHSSSLQAFDIARSRISPIYLPLVFSPKFPPPLIRFSRRFCRYPRYTPSIFQTMPSDSIPRLH